MSGQLGWEYRLEWPNTTFHIHLPLPSRDWRVGHTIGPPAAIGMGAGRLLEGKNAPAVAAVMWDCGCSGSCQFKLLVEWPAAWQSRPANIGFNVSHAGVEDIIRFLRLV